MESNAVYNDSLQCRACSAYSAHSLRDSHSVNISLLGTLSRDDDDGSENVSKQMNLRSFKLKRVYLDPLNMLNVGDFSWGLILKDFIHVLHKT